MSTRELPSLTGLLVESACDKLWHKSVYLQGLLFYIGIREGTMATCTVRNNPSERCVCAAPHSYALTVNHAFSVTIRQASTKCAN